MVKVVEDKNILLLGMWILIIFWIYVWKICVIYGRFKFYLNIVLW